MTILEKEIVGELTGVAAFIIKSDNPHFFLAITEARNSRNTNKLRGMISAPFETVEQGENHEDTLRRIFAQTEKGGQEEISVINGQISLRDDIKEVSLCKVQINSGIWLYVYLLSASPETIFARGKDTDTIDEPRWVNIDQINNRQRFTFRPGMLEIIQSYRKYLEDPANFEPPVYFTAANSVPIEIYDLLDFGVSLEESLFRVAYVAK